MQKVKCPAGSHTFPVDDEKIRDTKRARCPRCQVEVRLKRNGDGTISSELASLNESEIAGTKTQRQDRQRAKVGSEERTHVEGRDTERAFWENVVSEQLLEAVNKLVEQGLGSKLSKLLEGKLTKLSNKIQKHAESSVHTISRRLATELKKTEGRNSTFKLPGLKSDNKELPGLGADELQKLGQLIAASSLTESAVTRLISDLEVLQAREHLLDDLPNLFDFVDKEVQLFEKKAEAGDDPQTVAVLGVLKRIRVRMDGWMQRNNLEAFPEVGEVYDSRDQEWVKTVPLEPGHNADDVACVETKGYRFTDGEYYALRRARVICYEASSEVIKEPGS